MVLTPGEGEFLHLPEFDMDRLRLAWQEAVFSLYLSEGKIEPEVVEDMRSWEHSGFSVNQSVLLSARVSLLLIPSSFAVKELRQLLNELPVGYSGLFRW